MTFARPGVIGAACLLALAASLGAQSPVFRLSTDIVPVYVSVRNGSAVIGGLSSEDFSLTDQGVPQTLEVVSSDAVPVDVTLVVDTSRSVINSLPQFRSDVETIVARLQAEEQIRIVTFDTDVRQILPMRSPAERPPVDRIRLGDTTSLADAVVLALARARRPDRRHLVFVFTDGYDTSSMLSYGALADLASRTDSLVHIALVRPSSTDTPSDEALAALGGAAARTGGALYPPSETDAGLVAAFDRAIDDFRHSYVLYFTPTGVSETGWHDITVQVRQPGNYDVRARAGYFSRR